MAYIVGHSIKKPADFYGRSEQVARFFEIIGGAQAQSLSVLGLRRAGKTSFLQYVANTEVMALYLPDPTNYVMVYIDMSSCKSPADFYQRLLVRLKRLLGEGQRVNLWKSSPPEAINLYDVESLLCQFPQRRIVLLLDEFDHLRTATFDQDFLVELRSMTGVLDYDLACVTASHWDLYRLGASIGLPPTSPFYNIFYPTPIYLPGLAAAEAKALVTTPAERAGVPFNKDDVGKICQLAGSLPFFLQATAARWFHDRQLGRPLNLKNLLAQLTADLSPYFVQWWRHFGDGERDILRCLARKEPINQLFYSRSEVNEISRRLRHYGLLVEQGDGFVINGLIFTTWIHQHPGKIVLSGRNGKGTATLPQEGVDPVALRHTLVAHFDLEELRTLCFDLGVDIDELPGDGKGAKARDLVVYWQRRGDLGRLVEAVRQERGAVI
jgi:hypothetical protein